ncbi:MULTISPECIES: hypothetical protein [Vibrio]|uniref:hypothetical protein n=1 Tax=Vibrio TaxID=662 RepID=UPI000B5C3E6D|nr:MULTISPECIES: hypothetical protein [Vibrio]HBV76742.1 hypothetical protein [Vibrio sp.]
MYEVAILVVLYDCNISQSVTLNSIIKRKFKNAHLTIWNNGPHKLKSIDVSFLLDSGLNVEIKETLHNESLAIIYNDFLDSNSSQKYMILDHDSSITESYLDDAFSIKSSELGIPHIFSQGKPRSPTINRKPLLSIDTPLKSNDSVIAIGSGIVLGSDIIKSIKNEYDTVFDERFYLYGVDTTFFYRFNNVMKNDGIKFIHGFNHNLSRLEVENEEVTSFRFIERAYDQGLTLRYYNNKKMQIDIIIRITLSVFIKSIFRVKVKMNYLKFMDAYISGKHYRDK